MDRPELLTSSQYCTPEIRVKRRDWEDLVQYSLHLEDQNKILDHGHEAASDYALQLEERIADLEETVEILDDQRIFHRCTKPVYRDTEIKVWMDEAHLMKEEEEE